MEYKVDVLRIATGKWETPYRGPDDRSATRTYLDAKGMADFSEVRKCERETRNVPWRVVRKEGGGA
jgi:hypothetical protein